MREEGRRGEELARIYLTRVGLKVVAQNFCVRGGELDLVAAAPDGRLIFFEVKWRRQEPTEHAAVLPFLKKQRLRRAIGEYLVRRGGGVWRCDLLLLVPRPDGRATRLFWYRDVLRFDGR